MSGVAALTMARLPPADFAISAATSIADRRVGSVDGNHEVLNSCGHGLSRFVNGMVGDNSLMTVPMGSRALLPAQLDG